MVAGKQIKSYTSRVKKSTNLCEDCVKHCKGKSRAHSSYTTVCVMHTCAAVPPGLWDDASFKATGNLFWPDFWVSPATSEYLDIVYDMVGLKHMEAEASALLFDTCLFKAGRMVRKLRILATGDTTKLCLMCLLLHAGQCCFLRFNTLFPTFLSIAWPRP